MPYFDVDYHEPTPFPWGFYLAVLLFAILSSFGLGYLLTHGFGWVPLPTCVPQRLAVFLVGALASASLVLLTLVLRASFHLFTLFKRSRGVNKTKSWYELGQSPIPSQPIEMARYSPSPPILLLDAVQDRPVTAGRALAKKSIRLNRQVG